MAIAEEPILSRLDRLDYMLRKLEEMKGNSSRSSSPSTPSSGTQPSSLDLSPRSTEKLQYRPIQQVMEEAERKGTLLERINHVEEQLIKLCSHFEEEVEAEKKRDENTKKKKKKKKKGLKKLVQKVVGSSPTKAWHC